MSYNPLGAQEDLDCAPEKTADKMQNFNVPEIPAYSEPPPLIIKKFSKRLLLMSALLGCFMGIFILPFFKGASKNNDHPFSFLLSDDMYSGLFDKLPTPISKAMLYWLTDSQYTAKEQDVPLSSTPGGIAKHFDFKAKHPVFIIPGMTSTGLELWESDEKEHFESYFRDRLWGTLTMMKFLIFDKKSWLKHLSLDLETGLDPPGIKLRAAQGLAAADFLVPGYWVWGPIIKNLGSIGYDPSNLYMASFDWRLSISDLEKRDRYFSSLKESIEKSFGFSGTKAVIITHSFGSLVFLSFISWVTETDSSWVDSHIHAFVNICGPLLGVPKTISSLISGDMKDTAQLGIFESALVESLLSRKERAYLFRRWPCLLNMLPKGGSLVWSEDPVVYLSNGEKLKLDEAVQKLLIDSNILPPGTSKRIASAYKLNNTKLWPNPLESPLPNAPNLTIYSFYGVGKETEIGYYYKINQDLFSNGTILEMLQRCQDPKDLIHCIFEEMDIEFADFLLPLVVDTSFEDQDKKVVNGVILGDGDGTVPLRSLGLMGAHFWKTSRLNPFGVKIVTREYLHEPISMIFLPGRGGPKTSDHVDILGNHEITFDILRIVSGNEGYESNIDPDLDPVHISLVKGNMSHLAEDISENEVRKINQSLGEASGVLYEQDVTCDSKYPQNAIDSISCYDGDVLQYYGPHNGIKNLLKSRKQERILELQYNNTFNKLIAEAMELPLISTRYYSNIEEFASECKNMEK